MLKMNKKLKEEIFELLPSGEHLADRVNATINEPQHDEDWSEPYLTPLSLSEVRRYFIQQLQFYDLDDNNLEDVVNFLMNNPRADYQKALTTLEYYLGEDEKESVIERVFAILKYIQEQREWLNSNSYGSEYCDYFSAYGEEDLTCLHTLGEIEYKKLVMGIAEDIKNEKLSNNKEFIDYLISI